jgi:Tfp pilus assembly protein PilO
MAMDPQEKKTWITVGFIFVLFLAAIVALPKMGLYSRVDEFKQTKAKREKIAKQYKESETKVKELPTL